MDMIKVILVATLLFASVQFIRYAAKSERLKIIKVDKDFTVRYPRVYLWLCIVFFLLLSVLALDMIIWQRIDIIGIILVAILAVIGVPFLLLSSVWKIHIRPEYIIYINMIGFKRQIYYKDIRQVTVNKTTIVMETTLKTYRFTANIAYKEYFLKRLRMNGVEVNRYIN